MKQGRGDNQAAKILEHISSLNGQKWPWKSDAPGGFWNQSDERIGD